MDELISEEYMKVHPEFDWAEVQRKLGAMKQQKEFQDQAAQGAPQTQENLGTKTTATSTASGGTGLANSCKKWAVGGFTAMMLTAVCVSVSNNPETVKSPGENQAIESLKKIRDDIKARGIDNKIVDSQTKAAQGEAGAIEDERVAP